MSKSAARMGDSTSHGGVIVSGSANVFINKRPAANANSKHLCPMLTPTSPPKPHIGGKAVRPMGKITVSINGKPVIRSGDKFSCDGNKPPVGPAASVVMGSANVSTGR